MDSFINTDFIKYFGSIHYGNSDFMIFIGIYDYFLAIMEYGWFVFKKEDHLLYT